MDLTAEFGTLPKNNTTAEGASSEQKTLPPTDPHQTKSDGSILVQLLDFKTRLLEAVEELHIRRDAETHFEDQIGKLVLEKQGLEWEKDSQQHEMETAAHQHLESLIIVKKQFQAKIRNMEEEKGKYQVSVELKDKEINNLKEELKSLQLLKYNLEKKSSELEQKLTLQSRLKDTHLNQLGEVEKRFSSLSQQCAAVKQAHEKLEQNVDEVIKINTRITSANEQQEATITSLHKEIEELSNKLIKMKMSFIRHEQSSNPTALQEMQQLRDKLNMETEMNRILEDDNVTLRLEKQEAIRSLLVTQQLLLNQTQTVTGVELELQTQRDKYQALKQEHGIMREKSKALEEEMVQLKESYRASTVALKESTSLVDQMQSEQQDLVAVKEAYDELQKKYMELSTQAKANVCEQECVCPQTPVSFSGARPPHEPHTNSTLHFSSQTKNSDCVKDTDAETQRMVDGSLGEQGSSSVTPQPQCTQPTDSNPFTCLPSVSGTIHNSQNTSVDAVDARSDLMSANSTMSDVQFNDKHSCTRNVINPEDQVKKKEVGKAQHGDEEEGKNNVEEEQKKEEDNKEKQQNVEVIQRKDAEQRDGSEKIGGVVLVQTADRKDGQESTEGSADNRKPETEKTERRDEKEEEEKGGKAPETEIQAQTTGDKKHRDGKRSDTPQVTDSTSNTQPTQTDSQKVTEETSNSGQSPHTHSQVPTCGPSDIIYEGRSHDPKPRDGNESAETAKSTADLCQPLSHSTVRRSHGDQLDGVVTPQVHVRSTDVTGDTELTDKTCDADVAEEGVSARNTSKPLTSPLNEDEPEQEKRDTGPAVTRTSDGRSPINVCEVDVAVGKKADVTDDLSDCVDVKSNVENAEMCSGQKHLKNLTEDTKAKTPSESDSMLKPPEVVASCCPDRTPPKEMFLSDTLGLSLPSVQTFRPAFESGTTQRWTVKANALVQEGFLKVTRHEIPRSLHSGPGGVIGPHLSTLPKFLKGKHQKGENNAEKVKLDPHGFTGGDTDIPATQNMQGHKPRPEPCMAPPTPPTG